jgi:hypothetical protein
MSTGCHLQNGHHNTAQIQHCPISTTFHMWVDYDVPNLFPTIRDIIIYPYIKFWWYWKMLNFYRALAAIVKMTDIFKILKMQNCSSNGDLSLCQILCLYHYRFNVGRLWCPEFIPDIEKFLAVAIFKMAAKIQHFPISSKFDMWVHQILMILENVEFLPRFGSHCENDRHF